MLVAQICSLEESFDFKVESGNTENISNEETDHIRKNNKQMK